jgi:uncharacterized SAM-binding protein YcdF (DUF218 family)
MAFERNTRAGEPFGRRSKEGKGRSRSRLRHQRHRGRQRGGRVRGRRRGRRLLFKGLLGLLLLWLAGCLLVVAEPTVNKPARADAILVLGPPDVDGRAEAAYALARAHYANTVVVSVESEQQFRVKSACRNQNPQYQVICFRPSPATTRGEAEEIGRLAAQHHWKSILVVTSKYHVSRARMIVQRCMPGTVLMVAAPGKPSPAEWAYQFAYQTAGFIKALARRDC